MRVPSIYRSDFASPKWEAEQWVQRETWDLCLPLSMIIESLTLSNASPVCLVHEHLNLRTQPTQSCTPGQDLHAAPMRLQVQFCQWGLCRFWVFVFFGIRNLWVFLLCVPSFLPIHILMDPAARILRQQPCSPSFNWQEAVVPGIGLRGVFRLWAHYSYPKSVVILNGSSGHGRRCGRRATQLESEFWSYLALRFMNDSESWNI